MRDNTFNHGCIQSVLAILYIASAIKQSAPGYVYRTCCGFYPFLLWRRKGEETWSETRPNFLKYRTSRAALDILMRLSGSWACFQRRNLYFPHYNCKLWIFVSFWRRQNMRGLNRLCRNKIHTLRLNETKLFMFKYTFFIFIIFFSSHFSGKSIWIWRSRHGIFYALHIVLSSR